VKTPIIYQLDVKVRRYISHPEVDKGCQSYIKKYLGKECILSIAHNGMSNWSIGVPDDEDMKVRVKEFYELELIEEVS